MCGRWVIVLNIDIPEDNSRICRRVSMVIIRRKSYDEGSESKPWLQILPWMHCVRRLNVMSANQVVTVGRISCILIPFSKLNIWRRDMMSSTLTSSLIWLSCLLSCCIFVSTTDWDDCGSEDRKIIFQNVAISPNPILLKDGQNFTIDTDVVVKDVLDKGIRVTFLVKRNVGFISGTVFKQDYDFCYLMTDDQVGGFTRSLFHKKVGDFSCRVDSKNSGKNSFRGTVDLPSLNLPAYALTFGSGKYTLTMTFTDESDRNVGCLRVNKQQLQTWKH